ncbi:hypothetical protein F5882DRAFT_500669 [Hyaloscypha sp. PMI_1271]|nr:hypothetical protein F5882DRAFT_500669 [Hyaloscypha sp. PMI_1271]
MVYIWLGKETPANAKAIDCLAAAAGINILPLDREHLGRHPPSWIQKAMFTARFMPPYSIFTFYFNNWKAYKLRKTYNIKSFTEFLNQDWFLRAWTFQETILAYDSTVLCGPKTLRWDTLLRGFAGLNNIYDQPSHEIVFPVTIHYGSQPVSFDIDPRSRYEVPHAFQAFSQLLFIWMRLRRSDIGFAQEQTSEDSPSQSFYGYQKPYIDIQSYIFPSLSVVFISFLITHCIVFLCFTVAIIGVNYMAILGGNWVFDILGSIIGRIYIGLLFLFLITNVFLLVFALIGPMAISSGHVFKWLIGESIDEDAETVTDALMEGLIHAIRQRQATNPKEKSYAFYGVLQTLGLQLSKPNYRKSRGQVYHALFSDLLYWRSSAIVLLLDAGNALDYPSDMSGAPSWVPDWSGLPPKPVISTSYFLSYDRRVQDAAPGVKPHTRLGHNPKELFVLGHWKGHVQFCTERFWVIDVASIGTGGIGSNPSITRAVATFKTWVDAVRRNQRPLHPRRSKTERIYSDYMTMMGRAHIYRDKTISHVIRPSDVSDLMDIYMLANQKSSALEGETAARKMEAIYRVFMDTEITCPPYFSFNRIVRHTARALWQQQDYFDYFVNVINDLALNDRRPFITSEGFLGIGSKGLDVGDHIALVAGVPAPLILRPDDPFISDWFNPDYTCVCSAFVLGWMDGTMLKPETIREIKLV